MIQGWKTEQKERQNEVLIVMIVVMRGKRAQVGKGRNEKVGVKGDEMQVGDWRRKYHKSVCVNTLDSTKHYYLEMVAVLTPRQRNAIQNMTYLTRRTVARIFVS